MVQLVHYTFPPLMERVYYFNSTMVQLVLSYAILIKFSKSDFNSTMVQLVPILRNGTVIITQEFQFHYGSISSPAKRNTIVVYI